jgi:hypothetical protein
MTDSQNELYCEIGRVAVAWSKIECLLEFGIAHFSGITIANAHCMFATQGAFAKIQALYCLLGDACRLDEEFCRDMAALVDKVDIARQTRNDFQHCVVCFASGEVELTKRKKKERANAITLTQTIMTLDDIQSRAAEIESLEVEFREFLDRAANINVTAL